MSTIKASNLQNAASALTNITLDTSGGVAFPQLTGLVKANAASSATAAARGTDYTLLTAGTSVASTSGTAIDFTGIPAGVKRITFVFSAVSTNGSSGLLLQLGSTSIENTGYTTSGGRFNAGGAGYLSSTAGFVIPETSAANSNSGTAILYRLSGNLWCLSGVLGSTNVAQVFVFGGSKTLGGELDRVRFTTVNGTDAFDAGSVNIMWEY